MPTNLDTNDVMARLGALVLEEALVLAALSGQEEVNLRVSVRASGRPDELQVNVVRMGRDAAALIVDLRPILP